MATMHMPFGCRPLLLLLSATALPIFLSTSASAQAPLDFAIAQIRNSLGTLRSETGEVPVEALRERLIANFFANNFDGDPAISANDQLVARRIPNAAARADRLAEFHRADLDGDGQVTGPETQALGANAFWRDNPDGSDPAPTDATAQTVTLADATADVQDIFPLGRATLLSENWLQVATLTVPPGLDADGDGRVAPDEYAETLASALALADLDRDGVLSVGEITAIAVRATASDTLIASAPLGRLFWLE